MKLRRAVLRMAVKIARGEIGQGADSGLRLRLNLIEAGGSAWYNPEQREMMAATPDLDALYTRHIKPLPPEDRLRLLAVIARDLALVSGPGPSRERSLLELEGLGAEPWQGNDAQAYVDRLRAEWDHRP